MLAANNISTLAKPGANGMVERGFDRPRTPAWVHKLLGVRPAPAVVIENESAPTQIYQSVEGVSSVCAYRCYPR